MVGRSAAAAACSSAATAAASTAADRCGHRACSTRDRDRRQQLDRVVVALRALRRCRRLTHRPGHLELVSALAATEGVGRHGAIVALRAAWVLSWRGVVGGWAWVGWRGGVGGGGGGRGGGRRLFRSCRYLRVCASSQPSSPRARAPGLRRTGGSSVVRRRQLGTRRIGLRRRLAGQASNRRPGHQGLSVPGLRSRDPTRHTTRRRLARRRARFRRRSSTLALGLLGSTRPPWSDQSSLVI